MIPDLKSWNALRSEERLKVASGLALPAFELIGLETCTLGDAANEMAFFNFQGRRFVLVPGGTATLGYDRAHPYVPSVEQAKDLAATRNEMGFTLESFLDHHMSPLRTVTLAPFLIDVESSKQDIFEEEAIAELLKGYRLPTTDEWEYVCAGGTRTLFRWGNDCPTDRNSENVTGFDLHEKRNAFGLVMNRSTYMLEMCEGEEYRGGDGGSAVCGGYGHVVSWMPFASAFTPGDDLDPAGIDEVYVRRVLPF